MQNKWIHGWYIFSVYLLLPPFVAKINKKLTLLGSNIIITVTMLFQCDLNIEIHFSWLWFTYNIKYMMPNNPDNQAKLREWEKEKLHDALSS